MNANGQIYFEKYAALRARMNELYRKIGKVVSSLSLDDEARALEADQVRLNSDTFRVLVIGEFKRGKSTFVNALLGEEILPAYTIPCTAIINEIKFGEKKRAILHFNDSALAKMSVLDKTVVAHIRANKDAAHIPPLEVPIKDLEKYVVIPDPGRDQAESVAESPFAKIEIFWPVNLCRNQVEIIDSPGLNEHGTRTKITTDYLSNVDAVVFVLACNMLASQSELKVIDNTIRAGGHEEIFFVCNRFDEVPDRERRRLMEFATSKLKERTALGKDGLHFVSARDALDAKLEHDEAKWRDSGFEELEQDLFSFLVESRGRLKILRAATVFKRLVTRVMSSTVPSRIALLNQNLNDLEARYAEERPRLDAAEKKRLQVLEKISRSSSLMRDEVRQMVRSFVVDSANRIEGWIDPYVPRTEITFFSTDSTKKQCEALCNELLRVIDDKICESQRQWMRTTLTPALEARAREMFEDAECELREFVAIVDSVRSKVTAAVAVSDQREISAWERVFAVGAGLFLVSPGSVMMSSLQGFSGLVKTILPQIGTALVLGVLGLTNPWVFIPVLLATGGIQAAFNNVKLAEVTKKRLAEKVRRKLIEDADATADSSLVKLDQVLGEMRQEIEENMSREIASIRLDVESALRLKDEGIGRIDREKSRLEVNLADCRNVANGLDEVIEAL